MKKLLIIICGLILCVGCGNKAKLYVPDIIEPSVEQVKKSNLDVAKISFRNIKETAKLYYYELQLNSIYNRETVKIDFADSYTIPEDFVISGTMPTSGIVLIDGDGNVTLENLVINGFTCNYGENNEIICQ